MKIYFFENSAVCLPTFIILYFTVKGEYRTMWIYTLSGYYNITAHLCAN